MTLCLNKENTKFRPPPSYSTLSWFLRVDDIFFLQRQRRKKTITDDYCWCFMLLQLTLTPPSWLQLPAYRKRRMAIPVLCALFIVSVHVCGVYACAWAAPVVFGWVGGSSWDSNRCLRNFFWELSWDDLGPGNSFNPIKAAVCLTKFGLVEGSANQPQWNHQSGADQGFCVLLQVTLEMIVIIIVLNK